MDDAPAFWPEGYADAPLFDLYEDLNNLHGRMVLATPLDELTKRGLAPPVPASVTDDELPKVIEKLHFDLEQIRVFIGYIEHLSDRQLYELLWNDLLTKPEILGPDNPDFGYHWDVIGGWSEEDTEVWLRYYATDEERKEHVSQWGGELPKSELPPFPKPWLHEDFTTPL